MIHMKKYKENFYNRILSIGQEDYRELETYG